MNNSSFSQQLEQWQKNTDLDNQIDAELNRLSENRIRLAAWKKEKSILAALKMKKRGGNEK